MDVRAAYEARARAELAAADRLVPGADAIPPTGAAGARVMLIKGMPGPAEASGGAALSGADGEAMGRALEALGFDGADTFAMVSRPVTEADLRRVASRVALGIEAVDPEYVIALDEHAAADVAAAHGIAALSAGKVIRVRGRTIVALSGFEASLGDASLKKRVWVQLKRLVPDGPVW